MKRNLVKVIIFILLIFSVLYVLNQWFKSTVYYQNILISQETVKFGINGEANEHKENIKFDVIPETITVANFGSSHGRASFDYSIIEGGNSFNFGLSSQTLTYDYKLLLEYGDKLEEGAVVFFPITYITVYKDEFGDEETFRSLNERYYNILSIDNIIEVDPIYYLANKISPILVERDSNMFDVINYDEELSIYNEKWYSSIAEDSKESILEEAETTAFNHKEYIPSQEVSERMGKAIEDILDYCKNENLTPIFVTPPFTEAYNNAMGEEFYVKLQEDIDKVISSRGAIYLDYSHDEEFVNSLTLFSDPDHLNQKGAQKFTEKIIEDLNKEYGVEVI